MKLINHPLFYRFVDPRAIAEGSWTQIVAPDGGVGYGMKTDINLVGQQVVVNLRQATCHLVSDVEKWKAEQKLRLEKAAEERRQADALRQQKIDEENEFIRSRFPVKYDHALNIVMSGLSENSMGTGMNRSSVIHLRLLDSLGVGRLHRAAGDYLCKSHGKEKGMWKDDGEYESYKITCKACRKSISKLIKSDI